MRINKIYSAIAVLCLCILNVDKEVNAIGYDFTPDKDAATIYIYREWKLKGAGVRHYGFVDDTVLGVVENGSFIKAKLEEKFGEHDLWGRTEIIGKLFSPFHKKLHLEKGKNYYFGIDVEAIRDPYFIIEESEARELISGSNPSEAKIENQFVTGKVVITK